MEPSEREREREREAFASGFTTSGLAKDGQFMTMRNGKIKVFKNEFIAAFDGEILNINGGVIWVNGLKV